MCIRDVCCFSKGPTAPPAPEPLSHDPVLPDSGTVTPVLDSFPEAHRDPSVEQLHPSTISQTPFPNGTEREMRFEVGTGSGTAPPARPGQAMTRFMGL